METTPANEILARSRPLQLTRNTVLGEERRIIDGIYPRTPLGWFTERRTMVDKIEGDQDDNTIFTINAYRRFNISHQLRRRIQREGFVIIWEGKYPYQHANGKQVMATQICANVPFSTLSVFVE
jgi:hypothetical protein